MHRIDGDGNVSGEFTQTPTPGNNATQVTADWLNAVQNEIVNFLETNGVTLDKADNTQLSALMVTLFTAAKKVAGDYEIETVTIPGGTDKKIKITNKQTGKYFTITETRSPDGTTVEATHALGAVASGIDWIFDFSMHNYDAGIMKGVHVLQCFNGDTKGAMYWVIRHRPTGETGYGTMEDYYMMKLDETNGLQVNAAASEGVAPTWVKVRTASDDYLFATAAQGARADALGVRLFTASGVFVVPPDVSLILVSGIGGGGAGGTGANGQSGSYVGGGGGGGGSGASCIRLPLAVTPGESLNIGIGIGSNSTIGTLLTLYTGGAGGNGSGTSAGAAGAAGSAGGNPWIKAGVAGVAGVAGGYQTGGNGGAGSAIDAVTYRAAGGSAGGGAYPSSSTPGSAGAGYGSGGGGGGGGYSTGSLTAGSAGGAGKSGYVLIEF